MGAKTGLSVLLGAVCAYGVLAPRLIRSGDIANGDDPLDMKRGARGTMLWPGVAAMATDAFAQLVAARLEARFNKGLRRKESPKNDDDRRREPTLHAGPAPRSFSFGEETHATPGASVRARADMAPVSVAGAAKPSREVSGVARLDFERERRAREARVESARRGKVAGARRLRETTSRKRSSRKRSPRSSARFTRVRTRSSTPFRNGGGL